jgi:hypothetical protein
MRPRSTVLAAGAALFGLETVGHWLAYRLAEPNAVARSALLQATGHGYLEYLSELAAIVLAVGALAVIGRVAETARGARPGRLPSWRLAGLPAFAFLIQEQLERTLHDDALDRLVVGERPVLLGLALQVPCGFVAISLIRAVLRCADIAGAVIGAARIAPARIIIGDQPAADVADESPRLVLAHCAAERGPPVLA